MQNAVSLAEFLKSQMPEALERLRQMVGINSFTSNREGVNKLGRFTAQCFAPLGFTAEFVPSANPNYGKGEFVRACGTLYGCGGFLGGVSGRGGACGGGEDRRWKNCCWRRNIFSTRAIPT